MCVRLTFGVPFLSHGKDDGTQQMDGYDVPWLRPRRVTRNPHEESKPSTSNYNNNYSTITRPSSSAGYSPPRLPVSQAHKYVSCAQTRRLRGITIDQLASFLNLVSRRQNYSAAQASSKLPKCVVRRVSCVIAPCLVHTAPIGIFASCHKAIKSDRRLAYL